MSKADRYISIYEEAFKIEEAFKVEEAKLWRDTVIAYTSASNSTSVDKAAEWADKVVNYYKERYGKK